MPTDPQLDITADALANSLFTSLTAGTDFTLPVIDLSGLEFTLPEELGNPLFADVNRITEADLTDRTIGGTGLFDGLMVTMGAHIRAEYDAGRITGEEYSKAYIAMIQGALSSSVQYLITTEQAYWQAHLAQKQAQAAEIEVIKIRMQAEIVKAQLAAARVDTQNSAANYALTKLKLSTGYVEHALMALNHDTAVYTLTSMMPAQLSQLLKQSERMDYELAFIMPKEVLKIDKQIEQSTAGISLTTAQKDQVLFQTSAILPAQKDGILAETSIKDYQVTTFLPAQVAGYTADTEGKEYTNTFLLPAQLLSISEQTEGHRSKTLDTRLDGVTPITGAVGKQKELHQQQIDSYKRDAEAKVTKMLLDTWITQKSLDEGLSPPSSLTDPNIDAVMTKVRANLDLS